MLILYYEQTQINLHIEISPITHITHITHK
jgi:hypothetical protein